MPNPDCSEVEVALQAQEAIVLDLIAQLDAALIELEDRATALEDCQNGVFEEPPEPAPLVAESSAKNKEHSHKIRIRVGFCRGLIKAMKEWMKWK